MSKSDVAKSYFTCFSCTAFGCFTYFTTTYNYLQFYAQMENNVRTNNFSKPRSSQHFNSRPLQIILNDSALILLGCRMILSSDDLQYSELRGFEHVVRSNVILLLGVKVGYVVAEKKLNIR